MIDASTPIWVELACFILIGLPLAVVLWLWFGVMTQIVVGSSETRGRMNRFQRRLFQGRSPFGSWGSEANVTFARGMMLFARGFVIFCLSLWLVHIVVRVFSS